MPTNQKRANWVKRGFAGIPRVVMDTDDFKGLSGGAVKALLWLVYQYNGKNNGDLSATESMAKSWGIASPQTLSRALKALQEVNLVVKTREGMFLNPGGKCTLYALTWRPINVCNGKLDCEPTKKAPRSFEVKNKK